MYLLDSNVFISAKNLHYGMDFVPAFWEWLRETHKDGRVYSVQMVCAELVGGADELAQWAGVQPQTFFIEPDSQTHSYLGRLSHWATSSYAPAAIATFLAGADYFLVAQAAQRGFTVVTHERPQPLAKRIKIPEACVALVSRA
jgi:predicted nucleic acid-binding protein